MEAISTALVVAACIFAGALGGMVLQRLLPERHLTKETTDVVRLATGTLSVLASLVLGLLIATVKSSYDAVDHSVRAYAAELILLDETLRDYGPDAAETRVVLRRYTAMALDDNWPKDPSQPTRLENRAAGTLLEHLRDDIRGLRPGNASQTWLQGQALQTSTSLLQQRWLLIEREGRSVQPIVLAVLVGWIALIFVSFGLSAPRNATVIASMLICSVAIGGAIFLIDEMDTPFDGLLAVPRSPMQNALAHMDG